MNRKQIAVLWSACFVIVALCGYSIYERGDIADGMQRTPPYLIAPVVLAAILFFLFADRDAKRAKESNHSPKQSPAPVRDSADAEQARLTAQLLANKIYGAFPPQRPPPAPGLTTQYKRGGEESFDATLERGFYLMQNQAKLQAFLVAYTLLFARPGRKTGRPPAEASFYKFRALSAETIRPLSRAVDDALRESARIMGASFPDVSDDVRVEELLSKADANRIAFNEHPSVRRLVEPFAKLFGGRRQEAEDAAAAVIDEHLNAAQRELERFHESLSQTIASTKAKAR